MRNIQEIIREAEKDFVYNSTNMSKYVDWSMHDTIERVDAYLNSKHISGETDSLGRPKPFFNIVTAATNIWYRATDIDRKDIRFLPSRKSSVLTAFVANVMLQNWMDKSRFGQFLNAWGRSLARYGSAIPKFVEKNGELVATVVPWNRFIPDTVDFFAIPRIEKFYKTPAQLRQMKEYDQEVVTGLIDAETTRKNLDGQQKDDNDNFIEIYEVHGELDSRLLDDDPDLDLPDDKIVYRQQMHVVSFVRSDKGSFDDFTLFKGKEKKDPHMITHLIEEDGRTLAIGAVEYLFDAQWMQNHTVKNMKDTLDIASKLIFQTSDQRYVGKNVLSAIETGDIFIHNANEPLTRVANDKPDISASQNFGMMWKNVAQEITSTPDALRGTTMPSGTPYSLGALLGQQAGSLFEIMTENKGLHIEDMLREFIIPHIRKQLKNKDEIVAILDSAGIQEIDAIYIPMEARRRFNQETAEKVIAGEDVEEFNPELAEGDLREEMAEQGNKRFFKPDELGKKDWADIFSDFAWDNVKVQVTNENADKQAVLQTLASLYTVTAQTDPAKANMILARIMTETGVFSPVEFNETRKVSAPQEQTVGQVSPEQISNITEQ